MTNFDAHDAIEMIYNADDSVEAVEAVLDALADLWGAQWITLGHVDLHSGSGVTHGSRRYRKLLHDSYAEISRIRSTYSEIYRQSPVYIRILGEEMFQSPPDVLGSTALAAHMQDCLHEWRKLQGSATFLTSVFNCQKHRQEVMVVSFGDDVNDDRVQRLKAQTFWLKHLASAQRLRNERPASQDHIASLETVLNELIWGMIIVDEDGRVYFRNAAATRLMEAWPSIYIHDDKLHLPESMQMKEGFSDEVQASGGLRDAVLLRAMESPEADNLLLMYGKPLFVGAEDNSAESGRMALFLQDSKNQDAESVEVARHVFGMTEAEAACMTLFMQGATRSEVAQKRRVSLETIRSQASSIIRKTDSQNMSGAIVQCLHLNPPVAKR